MARRHVTDMSTWPSLSLEGNLIAPAMVAKIDRGEAAEQSEESYDVRKGLTIREEISLAFRVGQAHFDSFAKLEAPSPDATRRFVRDFLKETYGFTDLADTSGVVACIAGGRRVPVVVVPPAEALDRRSATLSTDRSRSPTFALQDYLNEHDEALWGLATNGTHLRLLRDNASLTRPAHIEADLGQIFVNEDAASFAALWLIIHRTRFGASGTPATDCALERWRDTGAREGEAARDRLAGQVENALRVLGSGFLEANPDLARQLRSGALPLTAWFNELLRLVYRLIFLMVAEDRDLLHPENAKKDARALYAEGYGLAALRAQCVRGTTWDRYHDRYEGMKIVFRALATGEDALGLPALGGLFGADQLPHLQSCRLRNRALMEAVYRLSWLTDRRAMVPVNWRAMETEELGSVYESLLELQPQLADDGRALVFASDLAEQKGNQRKTTGSYYTPDSLVQALLDTALDPVLERTEAETDDSAEALLRLAVVDPACGSGHFLLAAARRVATRVARIRTGGTPSLADFRHALRDVARRCIHGVDRNPMAVELTKVALWIETVDPGLPLGFFDDQIRCGDALLGVFDLAALERGIPDAAYKPLTGDDKAVARHYRRKNKREKTEGSQVEEGFRFGRQRDLMREFAAMRAMPEDTLDQIAAKAVRLTALTKEGSVRWDFSRACDLHVAAFLAPKITLPTTAGRDDLPRRGAETVPTSGTVWELLRGREPYGLLVQNVTAELEEVRAFHWPLEFPDIMARGGFDVVLGNPPWERIKLQEQEFFASRAPEIANAQNAAARKQMIADLEVRNPTLFSEWNTALRIAATVSHFIRHSGRFPLGGVGDINTYAVFTDLFLRTINPDGRAGLIVPNGLVTGFTYRNFLDHLLSTRALASFYGFENEDKLFKDVHNETKFGLLTISGNHRPIDRPWFTAHIRQPAQISDATRRYTLSVEEIECINPNTLNLPAFRWARDAEVTAAIHKTASALIRRASQETEDNPWNISLLSMFHMANDSENFVDHQDLASLIVDRKGALAVLQDGREYYPLYEGKIFWHFNHRYGTYEGQTQKQSNKGVLPRVSEHQHMDPHYRITPRYWINSERVNKALGTASSRSWFYAWRDVGISERTLIGTIIPKTGAGDKSPILISDCAPALFAALVGCLSSLVVDYSIRQRASNIKFFVLEQAPVIHPDRLNEMMPWMEGSAAKWIAERVLELSYSSVELDSFARDLGCNHPPFYWNRGRRQLLQAEIDAAIIQLYGLDRSQAEWLIDSFTVLRKYEERDYAEFRTKRLVLEVYDEIEAAKQAGNPYRTRLVPAPADPSLCHGGAPSVTVR